MTVSLAQPFILFLLAISLLLPACAQPATPAASSDSTKPVTITFLKRGYVEGGDDITSVTNLQAVEAFEERNPNIDVELVGIPWDNQGNAQLEAALESGENINVFSVTPGNLIGLAQAGKVSDIEPFMTPEDKADFYANGLQSARINDKIYAWPIWVVVFSIFANTEIFAERGIEPPPLDAPWTWEEFLAAIHELTYEKPDGTQVYGFTAPSAWWTVQSYPFFYIDGGRIYSPDGKRFVQNRPDAISSLQKIRDLYQRSDTIPPGFDEVVSQADAQAHFKSGNAAMMLSMPAFIRELEEEEFPVTIIPIPTGELGKMVTTGAFGMYAVYNTPDPAKLEASHKFAKYITGSQVAQDVPGYQLAPSLRRSNQSYATSPNREIIAKMVEFGVFEAPTNISTQLSEQYSNTLKAIVLGQKTPQEAIDEIAPLMQEELDQTWQ